MGEKNNKTPRNKFMIETKAFSFGALSPGSLVGQKFKRLSGPELKSWGNVSDFHSSPAVCQRYDFFFSLWPCTGVIFGIRTKRELFFFFDCMYIFFLK